MFFSPSLSYFHPANTASITQGCPADPTQRLKPDSLNCELCFFGDCRGSASHEAANASSRVSASLCLTEHVGLVPPPIFRDRDVCLFLFICWPTPLNKSSFLKISPPQFGAGSSQRIRVPTSLDGVCSRCRNEAPDSLFGFCFGRFLPCDELSPSDWRE